MLKLKTKIHIVGDTNHLIKLKWILHLQFMVLLDNMTKKTISSSVKRTQERTECTNWSPDRKASFYKRPIKTPENLEETTWEKITKESHHSCHKGKAEYINSPFSGPQDGDSRMQWALSP